MMKVAIKKERPAIPSTCPPDIVDLITTCWDQDPKNRPSANDIINILKNSSGTKNKNTTIGTTTTTTTKTSVTTLVPQGPSATVQLTHVEGTQFLTATNHVEATQLVAMTSNHVGVKPATTQHDEETHVTGVKQHANTDPVGVFGNTKKEVCKYDQKCYRLNPSHFAQYSHPTRDAYNHFLHSLIKEKKIVPTEIKDHLEKYRKAKGIPIEVHTLLCESLGWSVQEWEEGKKDNEKKKQIKNQKSHKITKKSNDKKRKLDE